YSAFRADEAGWATRSEDRADALRCGTASAGEPARRFLQPGRLPEPPEVWRAGAHPADDPRAGECKVPALWTDSSQYLHQRTYAAERDLADEAAPQRDFCGADFGSRGLRGVNCNRVAGGDGGSCVGE